MALKLDVKKALAGFDSPAIATDAYWKVTSVSGSKDGMNATITASKNGAAVATHSVEFVPDLEGDNVIRQAYLAFKALPEFANAEDV